ncbi:flocculation protein FLO11-like [Patiria miniata]|uniref:Uncharacterized protein n=1 Tax=Patiria miniata TaxID=46514 RepID=A0A914ATI0_PATMI|nr:flocculation protein FLO11-like [Patiria miniata]
MEDKITSDKEVAIPNPDPLTSISRGNGKPSEISSASQSSPLQDREDENVTPDDNSVSQPVLQCSPTNGKDASCDFTTCSSDLQVQEQEDDDEVQNDIESILKPVSLCSAATDDEFPTNSLICSSQRLQAEVVEDDDKALYLEGSNLRPGPTSPSVNDAPSSPITPTSSATSSQDHDQMLTNENRDSDDRKPSTSIEVPFVAVPSPSALSEKMEALERSVDEICDDEGSPSKQASASSTSRSGFSILGQSFTISQEKLESAIVQDGDMASENERSILVSQPALQSPLTNGNDASCDFTTRPSYLQVQDQEDNDEVQNDIESILKPVSHCSSATDGESPTNSIICSSQRLQAEVAEDGNGALDSEGSNSRPGPKSPSRNETPSSPITPTSSATSSQDHDQMLMDKNRIRDGEKPSTSIEVPFSAVTSPSAISEKTEALERSVDETCDDEGSPSEQGSASPTSRSGLSILLQSSTISQDKLESAIVQDGDMASENERSILEPCPPNETDVTTSIPMETLSVISSPPHKEGRQGGDQGGGLELISKSVSPSHLSVSSTSKYSSSSRKLGAGTNIDNDDGKSSLVSSMNDQSESTSSAEANGAPSTVDVDPDDEEPVSGKNIQKYKRFPPLHEQRLALKMNPAIALQSSSPDDLDRWVDVVLSCVARRDKMRQMQLASNSKTPYTREEALEIQANAAKAKDIMRQLNQMTSLSTEDEESSVESLSLQLASPLWRNPEKELK